MVRALLAQRFHLVMHTEAVSSKVYQLRTGPSTKLRTYVKGVKVRLPECAPKFRVGNAARFIVSGPVTRFVNLLAVYYKLDVIDKTGLKGDYIFPFCYPIPYAPGSAELASPPPSIETAVRVQLGLLLVPHEGKIEEYVVDRAEMPTPN